MKWRIFAGLLLAMPLRASAQVGYLPAQSPYRSIDRGIYVEAGGDRILGSGGALLVGPRDGTGEGLRFVLRGRNALQFSFGIWTAATVRSVIDANDSIARRNKGLFPQRLIGGEFNAQLNLTGGKTWHHLAPYAGVGFGVVHGQGGPAIDTSGYSFGTKLFIAPGLGNRLFISQRLYLQTDVRALFWKLVYPASYSNEPSQQPGTVDHSNAVNTTGSLNQYTLTPELRVGIGIAW